MNQNIKIRKLFPWFKHNKDYVYMDSGATTLKPKSVIQAVNEYYTKYCTNPHNTDSSLTYKTHEMMEETRKKVANLLSCQAEDIFFCSGATEGFNVLSNGLRDYFEKGDEIVLTYGEHASNLLPWMKLAKQKGCIIKYAGKMHQMPTTDDFINALSNKTKLVSFSSGFNVTGTRFDENIIVKAIKNYNPKIIVCVDAVQSIQHRKVDISKSQCDLLVISAHKMFGPTGIGAVYIKKDLQSIIDPFRYGGGMNLTITEQDYVLLDCIQKYEGGTPHVAGFYGWSKAIDFINEIGYDYITNYELALSKYARSELSKIPNITIYDKDNINSATIAINYNGIFAQDLASYLGKQKIIVRSGLSCAKLICKIIDTDQVVRISLYIYNSFTDIDKLVIALKNFKKEDILDGLI